jgi:hypothetical protein
MLLLFTSPQRNLNQLGPQKEKRPPAFKNKNKIKTQFNLG